MTLSAPGWQILHEGVEDHAAAMITAEGVPMFVVRGFTSERAVAQFLALYLVLLLNSHQDQARELLQSFMQREPAGSQPS